MATLPQAPRVTIIIPCLNHARFIERAICSVLDQGYPDLELIVTDAGSTDGSEEVIRLYQDQLALWRTGGHTGPAAAINAALDQATGEIVGVVHADALLLPGALDAVARGLAHREGPRWLVGQADRLNDRDHTVGAVAAAAPQSLVRFLGRDSGLLPPAASFYRRDALAAAGGFDDRLHFAFGYDLACRLLAGGQSPLILTQPLAAIREPTEHSASDIIAAGREHITAAERCAQVLSAKDRHALMHSCDERRRIYTLAQAEANRSHARRHLWAQLLRRPWWLADHRYRHTLLHGLHHPLPQAA